MDLACFNDSELVGVHADGVTWEQRGLLHPKMRTHPTVTLRPSCWQMRRPEDGIRKREPGRGTRIKSLRSPQATGCSEHNQEISRRGWTTCSPAVSRHNTDRSYGYPVGRGLLVLE